MSFGFTAWPPLPQVRPCSLAANARVRFRSQQALTRPGIGTSHTGTAGPRPRRCLDLASRNYLGPRLLRAPLVRPERFPISCKVNDTPGVMLRDSVNAFVGLVKVILDSGNGLPLLRQPIGWLLAVNVLQVAMQGFNAVR